MEANEKKSKDFLIIKNRTEHVLEENKHAKTKISKQQQKIISITFKITLEADSTKISSPKVAISHAKTMIPCTGNLISY